jgi:hypothetical protein
MKTFTIRVPRSWVGHISAHRIRTWISELRTVRVRLPSISGELDARISLRLPPARVRELVEATGLAQSEALRRLIARGLKTSLATTQTRPSAQPGSVPISSCIVSEEIIGEDMSGVVVLQRDARGLGYTRTLPFSREVYMTLRRR